MVTVQQKGLIDRLFEVIKEKFSEIELISITESPEDPDDVWVNVTIPEGEEREMELVEFASEKATDILLDYGYHISIMPTMPIQTLEAV
ncbi:MAG: hypothetical protein B6243_13035 [Anaerolineaceae bacterium 4572_5.2]|nr:MAG: hypothetical protein B6243_13035 [Anaerolineaceae bacterium 4572_5.2]